MGPLLNILPSAGFLLIFLIGCNTAINVRFSDDGTAISVINNGGEEIARAEVTGVNLKNFSQSCSQDSENYICRDWGNFKLEARGMRWCTESNSSAAPGGPGKIISNLFNLTGHIYGGSQQRKQYWPLDNATYHKYPYVVSHKENQGIAERYWLTSEGEYYYVGPDSPLFIEQNIQKSSNFAFIVETTPPYPTTIPLINNYTRCLYSNAREAHMYAVAKHFKTPTDLPDKDMIHYPMWSTARYKRKINQTVVLDFAKMIVENGFKGSQIQIDDSWESCYGSLTFDQGTFHDAVSLSANLKKMGFRVTVWVHPFINIDCEPFYSEALKNGYFVKNDQNETETEWWNGKAGVIDFTNEKAVQWWRKRIQKMMETYGIDSLKFDAGETSWLPMPYVLSGDKFLQPNIYTQKYVQTAAKFGNMGVVRVGFQTQDLPVFVRMQDKDSRWGFDNGLRTLVTTLFQMNMAGYPFVLPDKVGGNGVAGPPSKELFIRWLQATVFMPAIQFSYAPWDYDNETIAIAKQYTELHLNVSHMIVRAMQNAQLSGSPVNFPIWWISPEDPEAQIINDEFLLGEDILVAPVLEEGAKIRDIYLPKGLWVDMLKKEFDKVITGPVWLRNYTAKTEDLPYFVMNSSLKLLCEREDGGNWCVNGALSYTGGIMLVFTLSVIVLLRSWS